VLTRSHRTYSTGEIVLDLDRGCLLRRGQEVKLRRQAFRVLVFLLERHGRLVGKEDLTRAIWPDTFVSDDSLTKCITEIRKALKDDRHRLVKTVPRRGYIFDAPVESRGFESLLSAAADGARAGRGPEGNAPVHGTVLAFPKRKADNLPEPLTSFIGREHELIEVAGLLRRHRLITLVGAGGCGKTRLALEAARRHRALFHDGVWWSDMASSTDERLVADTVAASIGLRADGSKPLQQRLTEFLTTRSMLLVIDNCEHLLTACAKVITAVLRSCAAVGVVATSRAPLAIQGEYVLHVPGLGLPPEDANPDQILTADAVKLYVSRAGLVQPQLVLTNETIRSINEVCTRLDGVPLAIELAAARGNVLTVEQIATRLNDRFRLLVGSHRSLPRHRTLRATVDWSYEQLSEPERRFFRQLSVFRGTWSLDAATAVCLDTHDEFEAIDLLSFLLEKSLVVCSEDAQEGRRYRMLETMREYGRDRLRESGEEQATLARHLDYFRALAKAARVELLGRGQSSCVARLRREHDNLRAALIFSITALEQLTSALELAASLHWFWFMQGHLGEAQRWLSSVLDRPAPDTPEVRRLTAECFSALGLVTVLLGAPEHGVHHLNTGLRMARELGDDALAVWTLRMVVHGLIEEGRIAEAETTAAEALETATRLGTPFEVGTALGTLGLVRRAQCDYDAAAQLYEDEAAHSRASGERWFCAASLSDAAEAEERRGNLVKAAALATEGLQLADESDTPAVAWNVEVLARVLASRGDLLPATRLWGAADVLRERTGLTLPGYWIVATDEAIAAARARMHDERAFTNAWSEGRAMDSADAIALARSSA
jgi:predicted ATPase/DNA-binding winged helix-turn-helix (wHTH) protein